jgi:7,8-dihydropterin-6-yl-methyl-4-(beta-D-ribofuranosyl)aminobenzene 5'-phosphate synthase
MCQGPAAETPAVAVPEDVGAFVGERVPLEPVERVSVTTLVDNSVDVLAAGSDGVVRPPIGSWAVRPSSVFVDRAVIDGPVAEHGFSALVEVATAGGAVHRLIFDTGVTPDGMVENLRRLSLDPSAAEVVVCSHGHFDHVGGLDGLVRRLGGRANLPIVIHPEFWSKRRVALPGRDPWELPTPSRSALEGAGFEIYEREHPSFLFDRSVLITGEVPRTTEFERGMAPHQALRPGGWEPDPLILDDQALIVHVRGQGLVVLTGCGHAGIVNITRYARALTGVEDVAAVLGGFHLTGASFEPIIPPTVAALAALSPRMVVPAHCTGWKAQSVLAARLPDAYVGNSIGTRFDVVAA